MNTHPFRACSPGDCSHQRNTIYPNSVRYDEGGGFEATSRKGTAMVRRFPSSVYGRCALLSAVLGTLIVIVVAHRSAAAAEPHRETLLQLLADGDSDGLVQAAK